MEQLLSKLDDYEIEESGELEQKEAFKVTDLEGANWVLRKMGSLKRKEAEVKALADAERERINSWEKKELKDMEGSMEYFESLLSAYYLEEKAKDKKFKLSSPYGKVSSKKQQPKWTYNDEEVIKWALENEKIDLIRIKEELDKKLLKEIAEVKNGLVVVKDSGEIVSGVEVVEQEDKITITLNM